MSDHQAQIEELYGHLARVTGVFAYGYEDEEKQVVAGTVEAAGLGAEACEARAREVEKALGVAEGEAGRLGAVLARARKSGDAGEVAELRSRLRGARAEARRLAAEAGAWRQAARMERACGPLFRHVDAVAASACGAVREGSLAKARRLAIHAVALERAVRAASIWESRLAGIEAAEGGVDPPGRPLVLRSTPVATRSWGQWSMPSLGERESQWWKERVACPPESRRAPETVWAPSEDEVCPDCAAEASWRGEVGLAEEAAPP